LKEEVYKSPLSSIKLCRTGINVGGFSTIQQAQILTLHTAQVSENLPDVECPIVEETTWTDELSKSAAIIASDEHQTPPNPSATIIATPSTIGTVMPDTPAVAHYKGPNKKVAEKRKAAVKQKAKATIVKAAPKLSTATNLSPITETEEPSPVKLEDRRLWKSEWITSGKKIPLDDFVRSKRTALRKDMQRK
jgi:hypothetical protein